MNTKTDHCSRKRSHSPNTVLLPGCQTWTSSRNALGLCLLVGFFAIHGLQAQTYNWDGSGTNPVDGGTGGWSNATLRWTTSAYGANDATFVTSVTAGTAADYVFGGTAGIVSFASGPYLANSFAINTAGYIFESNSNLLGQRGLYSTTGFSGSEFSSAIFRPASGAVRTFNFAMATGNTGTFSASLQDNGSDVLNLGIGGNSSTTMGELILSGANTYSGMTTLNAGQNNGLKLTIDADSRLGTAPGSVVSDSITFNSWAGNGTTLRFTESMTLNANRGIEIGRNSNSNAGLGVFEVDANKTVNYAGVMAKRTGNTGTNNISIQKTGDGTLVLGGANTYDGTTTVAVGTLLIDGSIANSSEVNVSANAGFGREALSALSLGVNTTFGDNSQIMLGLGGGFANASLSRTDGTWIFDTDQAFTFTDLGGATAGTYTGLITGLTGSEAGLASIGSWTITNAGWEGTFSYSSGSVDLTLSAIPEPSSLGLMAVGLSILMLRRLRRS